MNRRSLRPGPRAGLEIEEARHWRIDTDGDGRVTLSEAGRPDTVLAAPGQVARAVLLRGDQVPAPLRTRGRSVFAAALRERDEALALLSDDHVLMVVPVHVLAHGSSASVEEARAVSGVDDFAVALGLSLEAASDADAALVRAAPASALHGGPVRSRLRRAFVRHCALLVAAVVALLVVAATRDAEAFPPLVGDAAGLAAALLALAAAVDLWLARARFLQLVQPPDPGDRMVLTTAGCPAGELQVGTDDVVHTSAGWESWLAGPRRGGVARAVAADDAIVLFDRRDVPLLHVPGAEWGPEPDALRHACDRAGIRFERIRGEAGTTEHLVRHMSPQAAGAVSFLGDWATILIGLVLVITHVSPVDELGPVRVAVVLTSLAAVILAFGAQQRHRRWLRQHPGVNA